MTVYHSKQQYENWIFSTDHAACVWDPEAPFSSTWSSSIMQRRFDMCRQSETEETSLEKKGICLLEVKVLACLNMSSSVHVCLLHFFSTLFRTQHRSTRYERKSVSLIHPIANNTNCTKSSLQQPVYCGCPWTTWSLRKLVNQQTRNLGKKDSGARRLRIRTVHTFFFGVCPEAPVNWTFQSEGGRQKSVFLSLWVTFEALIVPSNEGFNFWILFPPPTETANYTEAQSSAAKSEGLGGGAGGGGEF